MNDQSKRGKRRMGIEVIKRSRVKQDQNKRKESEENQREVRKSKDPTDQQLRRLYKKNISRNS